MAEFTFYLGIHHPHHLRTLEEPLFVSRSSLARYRRRFPQRLAGGRVAVDSGAFKQLETYGRWTIEPEEYVAFVRRCRDEIGGLDWAAPMDWMCEPFMLAKTGLTVREHQRRTVASVLELRALAPDLPIVPVIQGWDLASYRDCVLMYADSPIDLAAEPTVGLGSVCRRQHTDEIGRIVEYLADSYELANLHGFGVKAEGVAKYGAALASSDSMAWSLAGRHEDGCAHGSRAKSEANCITYALAYRERVLANLNPWRQITIGAC